MTTGWTLNDAEQIAERMLDSGRTFCPSRTGRGRGSLRMDGGGFRRELFGFKYLRYTLADTPAHEIYPRNAKALHFFWSAFGTGESRGHVGPGGGVFFKHVHHPGTKGTHWTLKAREATIPLARDVTRETGRRIIAEWKARIAAA